MKPMISHESVLEILENNEWHHFREFIFLADHISPEVATRTYRYTIRSDCKQELRFQIKYGKYRLISRVMNSAKRRGLVEIRGSGSEKELRLLQPKSEPKSESDRNLKKKVDGGASLEPESEIKDWQEAEGMPHLFHNGKMLRVSFDFIGSISRKLQIFTNNGWQTLLHLKIHDDRPIDQVMQQCKDYAQFLIKNGVVGS